MDAALPDAGALQDRVCIVTGGSKGMGQAFARLLAGHGARVALLARASAELERTAREIGDTALPVICDMADPASIGHAVDKAAHHFGRVDAVISNAAITSLLKLETAGRDAMEREMAVNLMGPIFLTQAAIPHLRAAGGGDLVYISSESVRMPYPYLTLYAAAKGGTEAFAAGMRNELREQGTRVTILRSGAVGGTSIEEGWDRQVREDFFRMCALSGASSFTGQPAQRSTMAQALVSLLTLPRDVNVDLIEIRGR